MDHCRCSWRSVSLTADDLPNIACQPATVRLLAHKFEEFSDQYRVFSEFPELSDESITLFLDVAQGLNKLPMTMRGNAFGTFQASVGIWQILARQGQIAKPQLDESFRQVISPFATIRSASQLYDAGRASLGELFRFSTGNARASQDEIIELLAGPRQNTPEGKQIHREVAIRVRSVLDDQRLVSLDTLIDGRGCVVRKSTREAAARVHDPPGWPDARI